MQVQGKPGLDSYVEESYLLKEDGFTVDEFAVNELIGKVAVLRRLDNKNIENARGLSKIEFYTYINMPKLFLDKTIFIQDTLVESIAWIGKYTLACSCLDGSVTVLSPFSTMKKRFQFAATPFWCSTKFSQDEIAAGTDSGTIYMIKLQENPEDEYEENVELINSRRFEIGIDQRPMAITASKTTEKLAVGCLDKIFIIDASNNGSKIMSFQLPRENKRATIAWSLLFLNQNLFVGDSRGHINIYDSKNFASIKMIPSHESSVLALATDGEHVFASGVDYRVTVIRGNIGKQKNDFKTTGQRIFHENDVKALAVCDGWLLSGGAQHDFFISKINSLHRPIINLPWTSTIGLKYQLLPSLRVLSVVERRYDSSGQVIPAKIVGITTKSYPFEISTISPSGGFIAAVTCKALKIYQQNKIDNRTIYGKFARIDVRGTITALAIGEKNLFYSVDNFEIHKVDLEDKKEYIVYRSKITTSIRKLLLSSDENELVVLTHRNKFLFLSLSNINDQNNMDDDMKSYKLQFPIIDFQWNESGIVILTADTGKPLILLSKEGKFINFPQNELFEKFEYPVAISNVINKKLVVVSNKRNVIVLEFDETMSYLNKFEAQTPLAVSFPDAPIKSSGDNKNATTTRLNRFVPNSRISPQWALLPKDADEASRAVTKMRQAKRRSQERRNSTSQNSSSLNSKEEEYIFGKYRIFLCGTQPALPPSQVPYVIRRYNRN